MDTDTATIGIADPDRIAELKTALGSTLDEVERLGGAFKIEKKAVVDEATGVKVDGIVVSPEQRDAYARLMAEAKSIRGLIEDAQGVTEMRRLIEAKAGGELDASVAMLIGGNASSEQVEQFKSLGEMFLKSEQFAELRQKGGGNMDRAFEFAGDLGDHWSGFSPAMAGVKDVYTAVASPALGAPLGMGMVQKDPIVDSAKRRFRVRDLFPVQPTTANLIDYFKVSGFTNSASVVPERDGSAFALKPQTTLAFAAAQAPVRTIAHWEAAHRNVLEDEPGLAGIINNELLYGLRLTEDNQILNGTGTGEDLTGILNVSGIQTYSGSSGPSTDTDADAIRRAMTLIMLAYYEPTGVVLHPNDWEGIELIKDNDGRYIVAGSVAVGAEQRLWRLPVVDTPAIAENTALVGAFGLGAQLYDRRQSTIRIAEQHSDFFVRNAVVILAEERLALATKRPESFCDVTLN